MPLESDPKSVIDVVKKCLIKAEEQNAHDLIKYLAAVRKRGYLTRKEFLGICKWKSPRPMALYKRNSESRIKSVTRMAFALKHEMKKIATLTKLEGVSIPMASALLSMTDPENYGIIDIRVWRVLYKFKAVTNNPRGQNFNGKQWFRYLSLLRAYSRKTGLPCRTIEYTLFRYHQDHVQRGMLYKD